MRQHFLYVAKRFPDLMDIKSSPRVPMDKHAAWKYLLHLDGQALSSRYVLLCMQLRAPQCRCTPWKAVPIASGAPELDLIL